MAPSAPITKQFARRPTESRWIHGKKLTIAVTCLGIALLTHLFLSSHATNRRHYTCAICRLNRVDYTSVITGHVRNSFSESSCFRWYRDNIESDHEHIWVRSSTIGLVNFYGQTVGVGDNDETPGRAIWRLSPDQQMELYKHFDDPLQAKRLFITLSQPEALVDRTDFSILHSLRQWSEAGFQQPWRDPTEFPP